jgi:penicillin-insensitive murein endopeptidase
MKACARPALTLAVLVVAAAAMSASAQDAGPDGTRASGAPAAQKVAPKFRPAATQKAAASTADGLKLNTPAKELFGAKKAPADLRARAIGFYSRGCLAGGTALPINGATWQVMRLSRNRNWGHPNLIAFLERLSAQVPKVAGWRGLLVGDLAQPRGGPMLTGHASHQLGLDADIWLTPMPERHQGGGTGPRGRARIGQCGDQEGAMPRRRARPWVAAEGATLLGPRLPHARSHPLSGRQPGLSGAGPGGAGRRLRIRPRLVVPGFDSASEAAAGTAEAEAADDAWAVAGGMPPGAAGALSRQRPRAHLGLPRDAVLRTAPRDEDAAGRARASSR